MSNGASPGRWASFTPLSRSLAETRKRKQSSADPSIDRAMMPDEQRCNRQSRRPPTRGRRLSALATRAPDAGRRRPAQRLTAANAGPASRGGGDARRRWDHLVHVAGTGTGPARPSNELLSALAEALRLDPTERRHLFVLYDRRAPERPPPGPERVDELLRRMLDSLTGQPAFVLGRRWDVLAWNRAAEVVYGPYRAARGR